MKKILVFQLFVFVCMIFVSCKSEPKPLAKKKPVEDKIAFIQVTNIAQMSYAELPCKIFFADGRVEERKTDVDGKVKIKAQPNMIITKIVYDFTKYKKKKGRFLAKEDFIHQKKVKTNPNSLKQEFMLNFTVKKGAGTILILDRF